MCPTIGAYTESVARGTDDDTRNNSYLHTALNKQETPLGESKLNILFPDLQACVDSTDQSMLSTGQRHRVTDALNEMHPHLAPRKRTKALKVCSCATRKRFYCESFYVHPPHLLPVLNILFPHLHSALQFACCHTPCHLSLGGWCDGDGASARTCVCAMARAPMMARALTL